VKNIRKKKSFCSHAFYTMLSINSVVDQINLFVPFFTSLFAFFKQIFLIAQFCFKYTFVLVSFRRILSRSTLPKQMCLNFMLELVLDLLLGPFLGTQ